MARKIGISRSHLQEVLNGNGVGEKVLSGLERESKRLGFNLSRCFMPDPIVIGEQKFEQINVVGEDNELLVSITSNDIIEKKGTTVVLVPYKG